MRVLPVEVPKLDDGLQLVQEPHHTVQGQLWGLQKRLNTKYRVFPAKWTEMVALWALRNAYFAINTLYIV